MADELKMNPVSDQPLHTKARQIVRHVHQRLAKGWRRERARLFESWSLDKARCRDALRAARQILGCEPEGLPAVLACFGIFLAFPLVDDLRRPLQEANAFLLQLRERIQLELDMLGGWEEGTCSCIQLEDPKFRLLLEDLQQSQEA